MTNKKYESMWDGPETVADFMEMLSAFPPDWPVSVATPAGGGIGIEHRERQGQPFVAIFGKNGGRFGDKATCYGTHYDRRIIERMVCEGLIKAETVDIERVAKFDSLR